MNNKVKAISYDALFVAISTSIILLFKYVIPLLDLDIPIVLCALVGVRYHKESVTRMIVVTLSITLLSFLYLDLYSVIVYVIPGLLMGIISHFVVRILLNLPYYALSTLIFLVVNCLIELLYCNLILKIDFIDYLKVYMELPEEIVSSLSMGVLITIFISYNLIISFLQSAICRIGVFAYEKLLKARKRK